MATDEQKQLWENSGVPSRNFSNTLGKKSNQKTNKNKNLRVTTQKEKEDSFILPYTILSTKLALLSTKREFSTRKCSPC